MAEGGSVGITKVESGTSVGGGFVWGDEGGGVTISGCDGPS